MPSLVDLLRHHLEYNAWATARLLNAATALTHDELSRDFGTADKSVLGTLVHLYRSERTWLERLRYDTPKTPWRLDEDEDWAVLVEKWPKLHDDWLHWSRTLSDGDPDRTVEYTDLKGNPWKQPLWPIVLHVVNHSTHHRGQVSGFLRALGKTPPPLDLIAFVRLRAAQP